VAAESSQKLKKSKSGHEEHEGGTKKTFLFENFVLFVYRFFR